jgi:hypothetical protein
LDGTMNPKTALMIGFAALAVFAGIGVATAADAVSLYLFVATPYAIALIALGCGLATRGHSSTHTSSGARSL